MNKERLTILVFGQVQGVGFRAFVKRTALDLGLSGYAENLSDGRVEVVAEGYKSDLEYLIVKLKNGPSHAVVSQLDLSWNQATGLEGFYVY
jgi:acylphosphatase